jgi:hypothetical protein
VQLISADLDETERKRLRDRVRELREEREKAREGEKAKGQAAPKEPGKLPSPFTKPEAQPQGKPEAAPPPASPMSTLPLPATAPLAAVGPGKPTTLTGAPALAEAKRLTAAFRAKFDAIDDYEAHLIRHEVVHGKDSPTEEILFQFRKPFAVYMRNVGEVGRGREVLYVEGQNNGQMTVITGEGDNRLLGAGFKTAMKPDNPLATSKSRHRMTEAGYGNTLNKLTRAIQAAEAGRPGLRVLQGVVRKEFRTPVEAMEVTLPPGEEPSLPKGGVWTVYFDTQPNTASQGWPMLFTILEEGREVEYYHYSHLKAPAGLTAADFAADRLKGRKDR